MGSGSTLDFVGLKYLIGKNGKSDMFFLGKFIDKCRCVRMILQGLWNWITVGEWK